MELILFKGDNSAFIKQIKDDIETRFRKYKPICYCLEYGYRAPVEWLDNFPISSHDDRKSYVMNSDKASHNVMDVFADFLVDKAFFLGDKIENFKENVRKRFYSKEWLAFKEKCDELNKEF